MPESSVALQINKRFIDVRLILGVLGSFVFFQGFVLLLPALIDVMYQQGTWKAFLIASLSSILIGGLFFSIFRPKTEVRMREAYIIVALAWIFLSAMGALPFYLTGSLNTYADSFFETMSGLTTTGATVFGGLRADGIQNMAIEDLPASLLFWRSMSHWLGGMGIIVLSIAIFPILGIGGMQLFRAETSGISADKLTPRVQETAKILWFVYLIITFLHFVLLWIHPKMDWFDALNHALSTIGTGGFSTKNGSVGDFDSAYIDWVITLFMFLTGINFALYFKMLKGDKTLFFGNREVRFYAAVTLVSVVGVSLYLWGSNTYETLADAFRFGAFQVLAIITTTGYGTADYELWPTFTLFIIFMLFFTGACAGSTSGGFKMIRWLVIFRTLSREIRQLVHPSAIIPIRIGEFVIDPKIIRNVLAFFMLYLLMFMVTSLVLSAYGLDFLSAMGGSIACLGNIGPGLGKFGPTQHYAHIHDSAKWLLSIVMMIGRLELFTVMVLFTTTFWKR